jgi:4-hydroxybenzoyl-CoA thioesterase
VTYAAEFTIRFGEIDQAGVVYYPRFFHYFHQTFESWFGDALGVPYSVLVTGQNLGFPSVSVQTEFSNPLRYGDTVKIELDLVDIGSRSITLQYTAVRLSDGAVSAKARIKKVAVQNDTFSSIEIPGEWLERFKAFQSRN